MEKNVEQREQHKQIGGITARGFLPGRSGNPNGRPRTRGLVSARAKDSLISQVRGALARPCATQDGINEPISTACPIR